MNPSLVPNCRETDNPRVICPGLRVPEFETERSKQLKIHEGWDFTLDDTDMRQPVAIVNARMIMP
jgi:hypothetical protein